MMLDAEFPNLSRVTAGLNPALVTLVGKNIDLYPVDVQVEYQSYTEYLQEFEAWSDSLNTPNFLQDY